MHPNTVMNLGILLLYCGPTVQLQVSQSALASILICMVEIF